MKNAQLLPGAKILVAVIALGACSNLQKQSSSSRGDPGNTSDRLQAQAELQSVMKKRIGRMEDDIQTMEESYLQQVSQSGESSENLSVAAAGVKASVPLRVTTLSPPPPETASSEAVPDNRVIELASAGNISPVVLTRTSEPMPAAMAANIEMPRADHPGQCFARVFVPPVYRKVKEKVVIREASERIDVIPAKYKVAEEQVLISEASEALEVVPATFKWVEEQVMVKPAGTRIVEIPATYKNVSKQVMVQPEHRVWKQSVSENNGEIMSLVQVPAAYKTVSVRVIDKPASSREVQVPAEYRTVRKQVVDTPATTRTVVIAAKYRTMKVDKLVEPSRKARVAVPAEYSTVVKTRKVKDGHLDWREILCDASITPAIVSRVQEALKKEGFDPGPVDGYVGQRTVKAINRYQRRNGLPVDPYLNISTIKALGVALR